MSTIFDRKPKRSSQRTLISMSPSQVAPFKVLVRKVADAETVDKTGAILGVSDRVVHDLLYRNHLTNKQAHTILPHYKVWKAQRARLAA